MAERMGAGYVTAGHVFLTECKKGLPARGLPFCGVSVNLSEYLFMLLAGSLRIV
ncbi:MAG: hypothetical protein ACLRMZ_12495 [Blautia marasmi]